MSAVVEHLDLSITAFWVQKSDSVEREYEDAAAFCPAGPGGAARIAIADGATEAYDARRWVDWLTFDFAGNDIGVSPADFSAWLGSQQRRWAGRPTTPSASFWDEERSKTTSTFGTFLGAEITPGTTTQNGWWRAVAVGDAVLIHVRAGRRIDTFPALASGDFGFEPDLVTTEEGDLASIVSTTVFSSGELLAGDRLVFATDALANWAIAADEQRRSPWSVLTEIGPSRFQELIVALRTSAELHDDDITMVVVHVDRPRGQEER